MKLDYQGKTCDFCQERPPFNIPVNLVPQNRLCREDTAGNPYKIKSLSFKYGQKPMCNWDSILCTSLAPVVSAQDLKSNASATPVMSGSTKISPNPVSGTLHIRFNSLPPGEYQITVSSMEGNLVLRKDNVYNNGSSLKDIDLSSFARGVYVLTIKRDKWVQQHKVVKQ